MFTIAKDEDARHGLEGQCVLVLIDVKNIQHVFAKKL